MLRRKLWGWSIGWWVMLPRWWVSIHSMGSGCWYATLQTRLFSLPGDPTLVEQIREVPQPILLFIHRRLTAVTVLGYGCGFWPANWRRLGAVCVVCCHMSDWVVVVFARAFNPIYYATKMRSSHESGRRLRGERYRTIFLSLSFTSDAQLLDSLPSPSVNVCGDSEGTFYFIFRRTLINHY